MSTPDHLAVHLYQTEVDRHHANARSALEIAAQRVASAMASLDGPPSPVTVADARHAAQYAAEAYAEVQAYLALHRVRFLTGEED